MGIGTHGGPFSPPRGGQETGSPQGMVFPCGLQPFTANRSRCLSQPRGGVGLSAGGPTTGLSILLEGPPRRGGSADPSAVLSGAPQGPLALTGRAVVPPRPLALVPRISTLEGLQDRSYCGGCRGKALGIAAHGEFAMRVNSPGPHPIARMRPDLHPAYESAWVNALKASKKVPPLLRKGSVGWFR